MSEPIMQFFKFDHLPEKMQAVSRPFCELATKVEAELPRNAERSVALRKLLEAKDAAVRAMIAVAVLLVMLPASVFAQSVLVDSSAPAPKSVVESIIAYILVPLIPIVGTLLAAALTKLVTYLHAKEANSKVAGAFAIAVDFIQAAFTHVRAGIEPDIKLALADGSLDAQERAALVAKLVELVKAQLPGGVMAVLKATLGTALETWLSGKAGEVVQAAVVAPASPGELVPS